MKKVMQFCIGISAILAVLIIYVYGRYASVATTTKSVDTVVTGYMDNATIKTLVKDTTADAVAELTTSVTGYVTEAVKTNTIDIDALSKNISESISTNLPQLTEVDTKTIHDGLLLVTMEALSKHDSKCATVIDEKLSVHETNLKELRQDIDVINNNYNQLSEFISNNTINTTELAVLTQEVNNVKNISNSMLTSITSISNTYTVLSELCGERYNEYLQQIVDIKASVELTNNNLTVMYSKCQSDIINLEKAFDIKLSKLGSDIYNVLNSGNSDYSMELALLEQKLTEDITVGDSQLSENLDNARYDLSSSIIDLNDTLSVNLDKLSNSTNVKIEVTRGELVDQANADRDDFNTKLNETKDELSTADSVNKNKLNEKIDNTKDKLQASAQVSRNEVEYKINTTKDELSKTVDNNKTELDNKIDTTKDTLAGEDNKNKAELNGRIDGTLDELLNASTSINTKIDSTKRELSTADSNMESRLNTADRNLKTELVDNITGTKSTLNTKIDFTSTTLTDKILVLNSYVDTADTKLSNNINKTNTDLKKQITDLSSEITLDITNLQNKVDVDLTNAVTNINLNINEIQTKLDECFQYASNGKAAIASAITGKGIPSDATESFTQLANKIKLITSGTMQGDIKYTYHVHVSGCYSQCPGTVKKYNTRWHDEYKYRIYDYRCSQCSFYTEHHRTEPGNYRCSVESLTCGKTTSTIEKAEITFGGSRARSVQSTLDTEAVNKHNQEEYEKSLNEILMEE